MLLEYKLSTDKETFYNITPQVRESIAQSGVTDGIAVVYCPHTTAGIWGSSAVCSNKKAHDMTQSPAQKGKMLLTYVETKVIL